MNKSDPPCRYQDTTDRTCSLYGGKCHPRLFRSINATCYNRPLTDRESARIRYKWISYYDTIESQKK